MQQLQPKTGNSLVFFSLLLLVLFPTKVTNKTYHEMGKYKLSAKHKGVLVIISWKYILLDRGADTA